MQPLAPAKALPSRVRATLPIPGSCLSAFRQIKEDNGKKVPTTNRVIPIPSKSQKTSYLQQYKPKKVMGTMIDTWLPTPETIYTYDIAVKSDRYT